METVWEGIIRPAGADIVVRSYPRAGSRQWQFRRGDEMGRFNMGSTVILLHGPGHAEWNTDLSPGQPIRIGQILGRSMSEL
jgi:phosphatidylserine decarboxylase